MLPFGVQKLRRISRDTGCICRLADNCPELVSTDEICLPPGDKGVQISRALLEGRYTHPVGEGGFIGEPERGRYGAIYPKTPACHGFTVIAKIIPGREASFYEHAKKLEVAVANDPAVLAILKLHYLRWVLFEIGGATYFMYQGIFDTDFDKYTEDAIALFGATGLNTVFENLEGFPKDWKSNAPAFIKFVRDHHRPSFLEYGEYPYASAEEIKKALRLKAAFSDMLDQMQ